jgi:lipoprotein-anchoring transpeptidase ErfK/SrfK
MSKHARRRLGAAMLAVAVAVAMAACTPATPTKSRPADHAVEVTAAPVVVRITPAVNATKVPVTAEIGTQVEHGQLRAVTVTRAGGGPIAGRMRDDGSAWVPSAPLGYHQTYTAVVDTLGADGRLVSTRTTFTTVPGPAGRPMSVSMNLTAGETYGVGMPVVVDFSADIPSSRRAEVQRRLFVHSVPPQIGGWRWFTDRQVMYRPRDYWKPGTRLSVRAAVGGLQVGARYVEKDKAAAVTIGRDMRIDVTNSNHRLTVTQGGQVVKQYPISMGKPSTPSWSGHFVVMERDYYVVFDTLDQPGGYRIPVNYAERITWSGTFIHSAPWSVWAQGSRNVSHGCVNVAPRNAAWIYRNSLVGDPVSISGTPIHADAGNGWTVWDMSWTDFMSGSVEPPDNATAPPVAMPTA